MQQTVLNTIVSFIKAQFPSQNFIPLHSPVFNGNEKVYVLDTIESTFVSLVGSYVNRFEEISHIVKKRRKLVIPLI